MGQPSLAFLANSSKVLFSMPGMVAWVLRWILVMVGPSSVVSMVTVAVVSMVLGGCSAEVSWELRAMVKQPAWAAAMSSSGLVPAPSSKRVWKLYGVSLRTWLWVVRAPVPFFKSPCQIADALRSIVNLLGGELAA